MKTDENGLKHLKTVKNGCKLLKQLKTVENGRKWLKTEKRPTW